MVKKVKEGSIMVDATKVEKQELISREMWGNWQLLTRCIEIIGYTIACSTYGI